MKRMNKNTTLDKNTMNTIYYMINYGEYKQKEQLLELLNTRGLRNKLRTMFDEPISLYVHRGNERIMVNKSPIKMKDIGTFTNLDELVYLVGLSGDLSNELTNILEKDYGIDWCDEFDEGGVGGYIDEFGGYVEYKEINDSLERWSSNFMDKYMDVLNTMEMLNDVLNNGVTIDGVPTKLDNFDIHKLGRRSITTMITNLIK